MKIVRSVYNRKNHAREIQRYITLQSTRKMFYSNYNISYVTFQISMNAILTRAKNGGNCNDLAKGYSYAAIQYYVWR